MIQFSAAEKLKENRKKNDEENNEKIAEVFRKVMESNQKLLEAKNLEGANIVLKQLFKVESLTLDVDGYVLIQGKLILVKIESFLHDTQQNTKKRVFFIHKF